MLKIRCSELHHIIGTPKKAGESLTQTAKSHLINTFKQQQFGFTRFKGTGCTEKGTMLEETAIKASGMVRGKTYSKNTIRRENDFITGECDIHDPAASLIIDTKCSWDIGTHPVFPAEAAQKAADAGYIWQMHGYMWLYGCTAAEIDFWLFPTPAELLKPWERDNPDILYQYTDIVEQIPLTRRRTTLRIERNQEAIDRIIDRVTAAQAFYADLKKQFNQTAGSFRTK